MAFGRPDVERLLRQVAGIGLRAGQAVGKLIERPVITSHQRIKIQFCRHINVQLRVTKAGIVPD